MKIVKNVLVKVNDSDIIDGQFVVPEGVISIGEDAFFECTDLRSIIISNSVTSVGDYAFFNCNNLISIIIPDNVIVIGEYAFHGCSSLVSIVISDSVLFIGDHAFSSCINLPSITMPENLLSIGKGIFFGCCNLVSINISDDIIFIGERAFYGTALSVIQIDAKTQESFVRILAMLPANIQQKIQSNYESFVEKATTLLAVRNHGTGFFRQNAIPEDIIQQILGKLATQYGIPPLKINQASQKFGIDPEKALNTECKPALRY